MIDGANTSQSIKGKMDSNIAQEFSLPTTFGKCLGLRNKDPRDLDIKQIADGPKTDPKADALINYAQSNFEMKGSLKIDDRGFLYVDLDNNFIFDIFEQLDCSKAELPPYFKNEKSFGAHISVALTSENIHPSNVSKLGEEISFTITGCHFVEPENWVGVNKVWFFTVSSPDLVSIRQDLGLSDKIMDHEFHITFAIEKEFLSLDDLLFVTKKGGIEIDPPKSLQQKINRMKRSLNNA